MATISENFSSLYQHWRYGEQSRQRNRRLQGVSLYPERLISASIGIPTDPAILWGADFAGIYDGTPDMQIFRARGGRFVYFKAADGILKCRYIDENVANAQAAHLVVGAYFWLYRNARISGSSQAKAWWAIVKGIGLDFHVVDFEWTMWAGRPDNPDTSDLWGVIDPFQQLSGQAMWIYSASGYLNQYFNHDAKFKANALILAQYGVLRPDAVAPWGFDGHTIHQISETWPGAELGVDPLSSRAEDGDIFNGDEAKFRAIFGLVDVPQAPTPTPTPPPSSGGQSPMDYVVTWSLGANVHAAPNARSATVTSLPYNSVVTLSQIGIADTDFPTDRTKIWGKLEDGPGYIAMDYPTGAGPQKRLAPHDPTPSPPPTPLPRSGWVVIEQTDTRIVLTKQ